MQCGSGGTVGAGGRMSPSIRVAGGRTGAGPFEVKLAVGRGAAGVAVRGSGRLFERLVQSVNPISLHHQQQTEREYRQKAEELVHRAGQYPKREEAMKVALRDGGVKHERTRERWRFGGVTRHA